MRSRLTALSDARGLAANWKALPYCSSGCWRPSPLSFCFALIMAQCPAGRQYRGSEIHIDVTMQRPRNWDCNNRHKVLEVTRSVLVSGKRMGTMFKFLVVI